FTSTAQTKEYSCVTFLTNVGRAVHAQYSFILRQYIVQYGEDTFLDFTGISRTTDDGNFFLEVNDSEVVLASTINFRDSHKARSTNHVPLRIEALQLFIRWADEHVVGKQIAPWQLCNNSNRHLIAWICTCKHIAHI